MNMDMNKNTQTIKKIHLTDRNGNFMVVNYVPNQVNQNESFRNSFHKHSSNALLVFFALSIGKDERARNALDLIARQCVLKDWNFVGMVIDKLAVEITFVSILSIGRISWDWVKMLLKFTIHVNCCSKLNSQVTLTSILLDFSWYRWHFYSLK